MAAFAIAALNAHLKSPPDPVVVLDSVVRDLQKSADERSGVLHKSSRGLTSFLLSILRELREIICGKGKPKPLGKEAHAAVSALAALLAARLGISDATAIGLAVLILITLAQATKNAFCKMDDVEAYKAIKERVQR
jgi:hypothetical protein